MGKKLSINNCYEIAKKMKGMCLSNKYFTVHTKYKWQCNKGHVWDATYAHIQRGEWCPICSGHPKLSIIDCIILAKTKNGLCLSKQYITVGTKYKWQCNKGHIWMSRYDSVKTGKWCPFCAGKRHTIKDCISIAKINKGKCLSKEYVGSHVNYIWKCKSGHIWNATYYNISKGKWCPVCLLKKTQIKLKNLLEKLLKYDAKLNYKGFGWLKDKKKMEIDIWFPDLKLAVEYDGQQHFYPIEFYGGKKALKKTKHRDFIKNKLIFQHPDEINCFIRFNYKEPITEEYVHNKLIKYGILRSSKC